MDDLISVIVPVYNAAKYLPRCADSILTQTYTNFQLILIDDGSTDSSGQLCDEYAARDSRIISIHRENGGIVSARNAGLDAASGEYITFINSDDWVHPQYLELLLKILKGSGATISACGFERVRTDFPIRTYQIEKSAAVILDAAGCSGLAHLRECIWGKLFPAGLFQNTRFRSGEDADFFSDIFALMHDIRVIFSPLSVYFCYIQLKNR